jgi:hypothetical protein
MSIVVVKKANEEGKTEPGAKHSLGISRTIYAAGYGLKDGIVWGTVAAAALFTVLTVGKNKKIPGVKPFAEGLVREHNRLHHWFKEKASSIKFLKWVEPAVVEASVVVWFLVGHLVQIPSSALGWKKAQDAIDKHEKILSENVRLVEATSILAEDNETLKAKLMAAKEIRSPSTDNTSTLSRENLKSTALLAKENTAPMAERIRAQQLAEATPNANTL